MPSMPVTNALAPMFEATAALSERFAGLGVVADVVHSVPSVAFRTPRTSPPCIATEPEGRAVGDPKATWATLTGHRNSFASLADIEIASLGAQRTVKDAGLIVEVTDHLLGLICYPNSAIIDVYLRNFRTLIDDASDAERNNNQHENKRRQASSRAGQVSARSSVHRPSLDQ